MKTGKQLSCDGKLFVKDNKLGHGSYDLATVSNDKITMADGKSIEFFDGANNALSVSSGTVSFSSGLYVDYENLGFNTIPIASFDANKMTMKNSKNLEFLNGAAAGLTVSSTDVSFANGLKMSSDKLGFNGTDLALFSSSHITMLSDKTVRVSKAPVNGFDVANKTYVDGLASGLNVKASVKYNIDVNFGLSGLTSPSGISLSDGDRVLVREQSEPKQNGIYIARAGEWDRAADMDLRADIKGSYVYSIDNSTGYIVISNSSNDKVGVDSIVWTTFNSRSDTQFGNGLKFNNDIVEIDSVYINALPNGLDDEKAARIAADNALGLRIDGEKTAREGADTGLSNRITALLPTTGWSSGKVAFVNGTSTGLRVVDNDDFYYDIATGLNVLGITCTSDAKLKDNVTEIKHESEALYKLRPVSYNWKDANKDQRTKFGFIAQDVEGVIPSIVNNFDDKYSIEYMNVIALLVSEVQKLRRDLDSVLSK